MGENKRESELFSRLLVRVDGDIEPILDFYYKSDMIQPVSSTSGVMEVLLFLL